MIKKYLEKCLTLLAIREIPSDPRKKTADASGGGAGKGETRISCSSNAGAKIG